MKLKYLLTLCSIIFLSCNATKKTNGDSKSEEKEIKFEILLAQRQTAISKAEEIIIDNQKDFDKEWKRIFSNLDFDMEKPNIDFNEKNLAIICLGEIPKGGHGLIIDKIQQKGNTLNWFITKTAPGKNCMSIMVIEQPVWFISFEKGNYDKSNFKVTNQSVDCE
jgi:hypothetical protein